MALHNTDAVFTILIQYVLHEHSLVFNVYTITHTHTAQQVAAGSIQTAYELAQYASSVLQRVCGGMHIDFCAALDAQVWYTE
jgi:hypothetical protein